MPDETAFTGLLVRFGGALRAAGLAVGSGDVLVYCSAVSKLDPSDLVDLYWAGRATLVTRHDDISRYDETFRRFFLGETDLRSGSARDTLGAVIKDRDDLEVVCDNLEEITSGA